jgi:hypothetical protein
MQDDYRGDSPNLPSPSLTIPRQLPYEPINGSNEHILPPYTESLHNVKEPEDMSDASTESHLWTLQTPSADDSLIEDEPSRHVDYLSHDWKEEDIWSSWRYVTSRRNDYSNGVRLENASWRTWAKAKYNLKTISPESLNW